MPRRLLPAHPSVQTRRTRRYKPTVRILRSSLSPAG